MKCKTFNHFARVCNSRQGKAFHFEHDEAEYYVEDNDSAPMEALIAHVQFDQNSDTYRCMNSRDIEEIKIKVTPFSPSPDPRDIENIPARTETEIFVFPDSGASICLCGPKHLQSLGLSNHNLIPCKKIVKAVGNFKIVCQGWLPVMFDVCGRSTKQALYVCEKVERVYLSKSACMAVGILPFSFPVPMSESDLAAAASLHQQKIPNQAPELPPRSVQAPELPARPSKLPFRPTEENVSKLKHWLLDKFSSTAFNKDGEFPALSGPPAHIHLKEGAVPKARHSPIPVPFHMKDAVKKAIDEDVRRGILTPVPVGVPTEWCSSMVITPKKDGRPRRTVDYQHLNSQCMRETHHTSSPFNLAMQVPPNSKKTVLDAVDGYHSVALDAESQPLTTFITEWGRYMYRRMPQGYLASGDAYTRRYDEIITDVPRKVKLVDDALLWDYSIEEAFYHTFDYLVLGYQNGVIFNQAKFQFCESEVQYGGLELTVSGVAPSKSMLTAISDFPVPQSLTDARSWFGLVNQVAWAYSLGEVMQPFRELVKASSQFVWTQTLQDAFERSKGVIVDMVREGVSTFDPGRATCLAPDWSKNGMGFLLLQKYCSCAMTKAPVCCPEGWRLVFAGSRFCNDAESRYAPIEGEASAIAWALQKCRMFVMGCHNLTVVTDHAPLLGIFGDRDISKITNPRIFKLKEKTLLYRFTVQHCPGRWHRGSDAMSRNIPSAVKAIFEVCALTPSAGDEDVTNEVEAFVSAVSMEAIMDYGDDVGAISPDMVRAAGRGDDAYALLAKYIEEGFPSSRSQVDPSIRGFWEIRNRLSANRGLVMLDRRIVIPSSLRKRVLRCLHSAHQGVVGMKARANETIYWPGLDADIRNFRANCSTCNSIAPSQPREPMMSSSPPDWPFQAIVMDLFYVGHHAYLACADRFTGWLILYHLEAGQNARKVVSICRTLFQNYGVPEELSSDGGPQFMSTEFQDFMKVWGVNHRLSSVAYPQSNGRAELGVKAAKRIVYGNTGPHGSLDNDRAVRAILQYRNTPIQEIGLSPAQMLLHRNLKDELPAQPAFYKPHPEWVTAASERERLLRKRDVKLKEDYNRTAHSLPKLNLGNSVTLQGQNRRWDRTGKIVEVLDNRQYKVKVDGSGRVTLRNRRFLRRVEIPGRGPPIPGAHVPPAGTRENTTTLILSPEAPPYIPRHIAGSQSAPSPSLSVSPRATSPPALYPASPSPRPDPNVIALPRVPMALRRLFPHNSAGLKEEDRPRRNLTRQGTGGERGDVE